MAQDIGRCSPPGSDHLRGGRVGNSQIDERSARPRGPLLDLVRRLNWLHVDLERGVRNEGDVKTEIAQAEQRLDEILAEIRSVAGQPSPQTVVPEIVVAEEKEDFSHSQSVQEQP